MLSRRREAAYLRDYTGRLFDYYTPFRCRVSYLLPTSAEKGTGILQRSGSLVPEAAAAGPAVMTVGPTAVTLSTTVTARPTRLFRVVFFYRRTRAYKTVTAYVEFPQTKNSPQDEIHRSAS